jgi:hypothetical protein
VANVTDTLNGSHARTVISIPASRKPYDWLRHASSDPDDYVDFAPKVNEFLLWVCTISFEKIFGGRTVYMMAFQAAFVLWLVPEKPKFCEGAVAFLPLAWRFRNGRQYSRLALQPGWLCSFQTPFYERRTF